VVEERIPCSAPEAPEQSKGGPSGFDRLAVFSSDSGVKECLRESYAAANQQQNTSLLLILYTGIGSGNKNLLENKQHLALSSQCQSPLGREGAAQ